MWSERMPGWGHGNMGPGQQQRMQRHWTYMNECVQMPMSGDEYLLWAISEGGQRFGTEMPAFREALTEEEIWKIIAYMRAGFP